MSDYQTMSDAEKKKEDWMNSKWRPMMGWLYMSVCAFDFVLFPIMWSMVQAIMHHPQMTQWQPLTLQGAGLFHIAMGAVLGIAAFGRTQEKLGGANNGGASLPSTQSTAFSVPTPMPVATPSPVYTAPTAPMQPKPVAAPSPFAASATPMMSSTGKAMPVPADEPEL